MTGVNEIRSRFIDFFVRNGHVEVSSSPLVPQNDPTLMFTNAGMVQFKNVFTGSEKRSYSQAVTAQKCVRAGGKHNDLDNVGYTARHHTFFEMLGNFSFGDYFKERAIELAWELITKEYGISPHRLLVTVYSEDVEAFDLWRRIAGLPEDRIIKIATSDNFWSMGDVGPCGPCSEIFYDHGDHIPGGPPGSLDEDGNRFVEIWNLVFMQYEQVDLDSRVILPRPSIDTGLGIERIAAVIQGTHDNYEIDLFKTLIAASVDVTGIPSNGEQCASHRVIADHLRAAAFLIADGVLPSNDGRGYVLRRIMRRGMRHAALLGQIDPLFYRLVPVLVREMGQAYPELVRAEPLIIETLLLEETQFRNTLERGLRLLEEDTRGLAEGGVLPGETAFRLYDTFGFPLDLIEDALRNRGIRVDHGGFDKAMSRQRVDARAAWSGSGDTATDKVWFSIRNRLEATKFLGYESDNTEGKVLAIVVDGKERDYIASNESGTIITNQTPFYGESGGQVGDCGVLELSSGERFQINDTQKRLSDLFVHIGTVETGGNIRVGDGVRMCVEHDRRMNISANHSATHLLHEALRKVLGEHVAQKGSLVSAERLRFDFSHPKALSVDELMAVETLANKILLHNTTVTTQIMEVNDAIKVGALALFGEKYGDEVRVVSMGPLRGDGDVDKPSSAWSVELCGGTHVERTGDIGLISVVSEQGVAAGVRRIEALTGARALAHLNTQQDRLNEVAVLVKSSPENVAQKITVLVNERRVFERQVSELQRKIALAGERQSEQGDVRNIAGVSIIARSVEGVQPKDLRSLVDAGKKHIGSGIIAIVGVSEDGKAGIVVGITDDLTAKYDAVALVRVGAAVLGGKGGGGRSDLAQAGGPDGTRASEALEAICSQLSTPDS